MQSLHKLVIHSYNRGGGGGAPPPPPSPGPSSLDPSSPATPAVAATAAAAASALAESRSTGCQNLANQGAFLRPNWPGGLSPNVNNTDRESSARRPRKPPGHINLRETLSRTLVVPPTAALISQATCISASTTAQVWYVSTYLPFPLLELSHQDYTTARISARTRKS